VGISVLALAGWLLRGKDHEKNSESKAG